MTPPRDIPGLHQIEYHGWIGEEISKLRQEYPDWDFWHVANYLNAGTWCGRPKGTGIATVNCDDIAGFRRALHTAVNPAEAETDEDAQQALSFGLHVAKRDRKAHS